MRRLAGSAVIVLAVACAPAHANDSAATLAAGGIVLTKSDGIVLEQEDLTIRLDRVRVAYVFRNVSGEDVRTRVAFPLPSVEDVMQDIVWDHRRPDDPMHFSVVVDGKPQPFETEMKDGVARHHHWMQTFPKDRAVSVEHEYAPVAGSFAVGFPEFAFDDEQKDELVREYCAGPALLEWIRTRGGAYGFVHYVLKSGANWGGPIRRFKLTLEKSSPEDRVSLCIPGRPVQPSPTTFVVERTDFEPRQDLKIFFMSPRTVHEELRGDWTPDGVPCGSGVRLRVDARAMTLVNGEDTLRLAAPDVCRTCDHDSDEQHVTRLTAVRAGDATVVVRIRGFERDEASARVDLPPRLARRFPLADSRLRWCPPGSAVRR